MTERVHHELSITVMAQGSSSLAAQATFRLRVTDSVKTIAAARALLLAKGRRPP